MSLRHIAPRTKRPKQHKNIRKIALTAILALGLGAMIEAPAAARIHWHKNEKQALELLQVRHRPELLQVRQRPMSRLERNQEIARSMVGHYGWSGGEQFHCLDRLWMRESHWDHRAHNSSGAHGIPQALPGAKMASVGADWRTNPRTQIHWGLNYIKGRYGSPCTAWSHSQATGWY
ncbi:MAG: hypothetical protein JWN00_190 [Actinomycetia bacterium]|nr:hypothetical protein [Actinomycetes bacterium]